MEHVEGRQSVLAALLARQRRIEMVLVTHGAHMEKLQELLDAAAELNIPVKQVTSRELDAMAHGSTHGGVLAICSAKPRATAEQLLEIVDRCTKPPLLILIEGIEDARNLGFVLRSAEALGADAVLVKKHLWDLDSVEIARPSSGAYERLPLAQVEGVEVLQQLQRKGLRIFGCVGGARRTIYDADLAVPAILAIGGEKRGLSGAVRAICDVKITIPTGGAATSLSLSHAAAIVLGEANRQRRAISQQMDAQK